MFNWLKKLFCNELYEVIDRVELSPVNVNDESVALIKSTHSHGGEVQFDFDRVEFDRAHPGWLSK